MRKFISTIVFMIVAYSVYGQTDSIGNWLVNMSVGIEAHDKRLFDYSEKESLLEMQPEFWGNYHFGFNLKRSFFQIERLSSLAGLGVSFEKSTFLRPFDHFHFKEDSTKILRNLNRYQKVQFPLTFTILYQLSDNWIVSGLL